MDENALDMIVGKSRAALSVLKLWELRKIEAQIWGHASGITKPKLVHKIWEYARTL